MKRAFYFIILIIGIALVGSCKKAYFDFDKFNMPQWDPNVAAPIINSSISISDIIEQSDEITPYTIVNSDSSVTIVYAGNVFSVKAFELIDLSNIQSDIGMRLNSTEIIDFNLNQTVVKDTSFLIPLVVGGSERLDEALLKSGITSFQLTSYFSHSGTLKITVPQLTDVNGEQFEEYIPLNYNSSLPVVTSADVDLTNYRLLGANTGNPDNTLEVFYELTLNNSGNTTLTSNELEISNSITGLDFYEVKGYLGQTIFNLDEDSININLFNNTDILGGFELVDPTIKIKFRNSYGVPFSITPQRFDAYSQANGTFSIDGFPSSLLIQPALQLGDTSITTYTISNQNSNNINQLISSMTKWLIYDFDGQPNPAGDITQNFATDSSLLEVDLDVEVPLDGRAWDFIFQDTFDFAFDEKIEEVDWALFRLNVNNGFPLDALAQLYFADSTYQIIDSLVTPLEPLIISGAINQNNIVSAPTRTISDFLVDGERIVNLTNTKYVILSTDLETANAGQTQVKIYSYYEMELRLGLQVQFNFDPDNLDL